MIKQIQLLPLNLIISLVTCSIAILAPTQLISAHEIKNLKVCWESELKPPYLMKDKQGKLEGAAIDWLKHILVTQNISYQNVLMPWKRCLHSLEKGHVDLVPNSSYSTSRTQFAHYTQELYRTHLDFFYLKDKFPHANDLTSIKQFSPYNVGGVRGFNYSFYKGKITIDRGASNRRSLVNKLKRGRVDFAILQREVIASIYKDEPQALFGLTSILAPENNYKPFYVLVGRANKQAATIVTEFDIGLNKLQQSGVYDQVLEKYLK